MTSIVGLTELLNVTVTPAPGSVQDTNLKQVAGNAVDTGVGASTGGTQRVALSTDSTVKIVDGSTTPITGSLSNNGTLISTDTLGYNSISVQFTGMWTAEVTFQASNDNVNWVNVQGYAFNSTMSAIDTVVDNDIYVFPVIGRYFQVVVSGYVSGPISATAYLRSQSLAGIGEAALTQAMDQANGTPINVGFQGFQGPGQQNAANSLPVALANEDIRDLYIAGRAFSGGIPVNTILTNDASVPNQQGWIDCSQYRSIVLYINQSAAVTSGVVSFEFSNDGANLLNNPVGLFDTQGVDSTPLISTTSSTFSTTGAKTIARFGNIAWRYFRLRITTAVASTAAVIQAFVMLRMTMSPVVFVPQANLQSINGGQFPTQTATALNNAISTTNNTAAYMPVGGDDKSVVNPQIQGAGYPIASTNAAYVAGPFYRRNYVDFAGGIGVAGPDPRYAEDKTYPVNVRLERTTNGQESVQDMLRQILVELKALSYYTRELPMAISSLNQTPSPSIFGMPSSMADDPENLYNDQTLFDYRKGN